MGRKKGKERVRCELCKKYFKIINLNHLKMHGITVQEYKDRFPNSEMISKLIKEKKNKRNIQIQCKLCMKYFDMINAIHLKDKHGISIQEYKDRFSGVEMIVKEMDGKVEKYISPFIKHERLKEIAYDRLRLKNNGK